MDWRIVEKKEGCVLALDLSLSNSGVAVFNSEEDLLYFTSIPTDSKNSQQVRIKNIIEKIISVAEEYAPKVVVFEKGFFRFIKSTAILNRVLGAAMFALVDYPLYFYESSSVKKMVAGRGNADKKTVQESVCKRYPVAHFDDYDQSDACAVGMAFFMCDKDLIFKDQDE
jgi:crossover junction endodeoxyribonuclease RuvC